MIFYDESAKREYNRLMAELEDAKVQANLDGGDSYGVLVIVGIVAFIGIVVLAKLFF